MSTAELPGGVPESELKTVKAHGLGQTLGQGQDQSQRVFSDNRPVNAARIGDGDVAGDQFGKKKLVNRSGGRVNPL